MLPTILTMLTLGATIAVLAYWLATDLDDFGENDDYDDPTPA